jgi:chromosome segregation ATPase
VNFHPSSHMNAYADPSRNPGSEHQAPQPIEHPDTRRLINQLYHEVARLERALADGARIVNTAYKFVKDGGFDADVDESEEWLLGVLQAMRQSRDMLQRANDELAAALDCANREVHKLRNSAKMPPGERVRLQREVLTIREDMAAMERGYARCQLDRDAAIESATDFQRHFHELNYQYETLLARHDELLEQKSQLDGFYKTLHATHESMRCNLAQALGLLSSVAQ